MPNIKTKKSKRTSFKVNKKLFKEVKEKILKRINKSASDPEVIRQIIASLPMPQVDKLVDDPGIKEILNHTYKGKDCSITVRISDEDRTTLEKLSAAKSLSMNGLISNAMVVNLYSEDEIAVYLRQLK